MYAVPATTGDGAIVSTRPNDGSPGGVTFDQCLPPSRVSWTRPSSVPTQISPLRSVEPSMSRIVSLYSAPETSWTIGPPVGFWCDLSLTVRSGEIVFQLMPRSVDWNTTLAP